MAPLRNRSRQSFSSPRMKLPTSPAVYCLLPGGISAENGGSISVTTRGGAMMRSIDVNEAIDIRPFGSFQWRVVGLCALFLVVDGYDVFVAGTVLPTLMADWGLSKPEAGALQAWALFGMMFGALFFGPLADRIGRKKGIAISFLLFTVSTLLTGFATSPGEFKVFRFVAGLGCG